MAQSIVLTFLLALLLLPAASAAGEEPAAIDLASDRELFVDGYLIDSLDGVQHVLSEPRDEGAVFRFDKPWEGPFCGYATVIDRGEDFLLYYRGLPRAGSDGTAIETTCVALSSDGITWTRPELGLFEVAGTRKNNVVLAHAAPVTHNFSPFLDTRTGVEPEHRFKALGGTKKSGLMAYSSPDGFRWTKIQDEPVFTKGIFDSQNVAFWSEHEQCYLCYFRTWSGKGYTGFRTMSRTTSKDFLAWTEPEAMSFGDRSMEHLYTNQTHPYFRAPQIYVAIAARFMPGRQVVSEMDALKLGVNPGYFRDCSDAVFMTSRGGSTYDRTFMSSFIRPGVGLENWVSRSNYPALNVVRTGPAEMSVYVNANYAQPTAELRRYSLRLDGFASIRAPFEGGEMTTRPFLFRGDRLLVNFATSAAGGIRVEVQDSDGRPLPGFSLKEAVEQIGNEIERTVAWKRGPDLGSLEGKAVRLRFVMKDASLYAIRFE